MKFLEEKIKELETKQNENRAELMELDAALEDWREKEYIRVKALEWIERTSKRTDDIGLEAFLKLEELKGESK